MQVNDWISVVAPMATTLTAALVASVSFLTVRQERKRNEDLKRVLADSLANSTEVTTSVVNRFDLLSDYITQLQQLQMRISRDLSSEIAEEVSGEVSESIHRELRNLSIQEIKHPSQQLVGLEGLWAAADSGRDLWRNASTFRTLSELSHSLKTPFAHLEASLRELAVSDPVRSDDVKEVANDLLVAVELCKSTLSAFREVSRVSGQAEEWHPRSLDKALLDAVRVYSRTAKKALTASIEVPPTIPGYSNNYLIAILLPIIENAVEASPDDCSIAVKFASQDRQITFTVLNKSSDPVDMSCVESPGKTTKPGHDGLGVQVVRDLASAKSGGKAHFAFENGTFTSVISLPEARLND